MLRRLRDTINRINRYGRKVAAVSREVPEYRKRSDGYAFVEHRTIATKSRRMVLGKWGSIESKQRYQAFLAQLDNHSSLPTIVAGQSPLLEDLMTAYLDEAEKLYRQPADSNPTCDPDGEFELTSEYHGMVQAISALERYCDLEPRFFGPKKLVAVRSALAQNGLARSTVNHIVSRIKRFFAWACENELAPPELYHRLLCVKGLRKGQSNCRETAPIQPAPAASFTGLLPYLTPTVRTMAETQYRCGMRPGETCRLGLEFIDTRSHTWLYYPGRHKTQWRGATLIKAIPPSVQVLIAPYVEAGRFCFPTDRGEERYTTSGYRQAFDRGFSKAAAAGVALERFRPNQLRHAIATQLEEKLGLEAAQKWCGHEKPDTTKLYTKRRATDLLTLADQVETVLSANACM